MHPLLIARPPALSANTALRETLERHGVRRWLYAGESAEDRIALERGPLSYLERIPTGPLFARAFARLREPYREWIAELSASDGSELWWTSELASRNPHYWLFTRICALAVAADLAGTEPLLAVCSTDALARELVPIARENGAEPVPIDPRRRLPPIPRERARAMASALVARSPRAVAAGAIARRRWLSTDPEYRRRVLTRMPPPALAESPDVLLITWADERAIAGEEYSDGFLGPLEDQLRGAGYRATRLVQVLPGAPFERIARRLRELDPSVLFTEEWASPSERRECARRARSFSPSLDPEARIDGVPATALALENVDETRREHARSLRWGPVIANLAAAEIRPSALIHPFEGHSWERALRSAAATHLPGSTVIGSDMSTFSRWVLSVFPTGAEVAVGPFPDRIVAGGRVLGDLLVEQSYPADRVRLGAALRHAYLHDLERPRRERPGAVRPFRALVATGIDFAESVELVSNAATEFGARDGWRLTAKAHPAIDRARLRAAVRQLTGRDVEFVDAPIPELLPSADVLLYAYTSVCWEALGFDVLPVFVRPEGTLPLDKLEAFPELTVSGGAGEGLPEAVEEKLGWDDAGYARWRARGREALELAMAPPRDDLAEVFLGGLESR